METLLLLAHVEELMGSPNAALETAQKALTLSKRRLDWDGSISINQTRPRTRMPMNRNAICSLMQINMQHHAASCSMNFGMNVASILKIIS